MLKRLAILLIIAFPLNIFSGYVMATLSIVFVQAIFYFLFELSYVLKDENQLTPLYLPVVFGLVTSVNGVGRFTFWIMNKFMPRSNSEIEIVYWSLTYIVTSIILTSLILKIIGFINTKFHQKDSETL